MKTGGPAFPNVPEGAGDRWNDWDMGMSLRDYFAAKAMQGILANPGQLDSVTYDSAEWVARDAYRVAAAMLKAREGE